MTTTERRRPTAGKLSRDSKLYLLALLATGYVAAWWLFAAPAPRRDEMPPPPAAPPGRAPAGTVAWLHQLAPASRPPVAPPPGWRLVERSPTALPGPRSMAAPGRVASPRPRRIRTRSS
jgi:hypothetical protein